MDGSNTNSNSNMNSDSDPHTQGVNKITKAYVPRRNTPAWAFLLALRLARASSSATAASKSILCGHLKQPSYQVRLTRGGISA